MALDKKYYDQSTIGSAEELDTYGVWVKSGPQDLTEGLASAANMDAEFESDFESGAIPFEDDFDENFGSLGVVGMGLTDGMDDISEDSSFDEAITTQLDRNAGDAPTPLIMKIADEITSIRSELNTLKKEFADIRSEGTPGIRAESPQGGFFDEGEDETIALTGDEMDNFLTSADFSDEEGQDPQREADEAALKELSEQNESADEEMEELPPDEEIAPLEEPSLEESPFEETPLEETLPVESPATFDEDFETPSFDGLSLEESPETEESLDFTEDLTSLEPLEPVEESDELQSLRLEGAIPQTPPPDNLDYLESDPFALDEAALEESSLEESGTSEEADTEETVTEETISEETTLGESSLDESAVAEDALSLDSGADDLTFEDSAFDLSLDDLSLEEEPADEPVPEADELAEPALEDIELSLDSETDELAEPVFEDEELSLDSETNELAEPVFEDEELSLDSEADELAEPALEDIELSLDSEIDKPAEPALENEELSLDSEIDELAEPALEDTELSLDTESAEPAEPVLDDPGLSFDSDSLELSEAVLDDADFSFDADSPETAGEEPIAEQDLSTMEITDEEMTEEQAFDAESLDLSDAVIDEPDISAEDIVEPPLEEPAPGDISLDMDDFGTIDLETDAIAAVDSGQTNGIIDDSLAQVIPEGFEVDAAEADVSQDDDLEAFAEDELAASASGAESGAHGELGIPSGLETELKKVLSYMDHLLESLPEDKIEEFAKSEYFDTYKKIFKELGLV
jgi:hypothetical protein